MDRRRHLIPAAVAALALAAPAALAALAGAAKYAGTTSDGSAVTIKLAGDARSVKRMRIHYDLSCNHGRTHTYTDILGPRVHKDRSFAAFGNYTGTQDGSKNTFHVSGKLSAGKAHGKFSLKASGRASDGTKLSCKTGELTWSAQRQK